MEGNNNTSRSPSRARQITEEDIAINTGHQNCLGEPPGTTIVNGRRDWLTNFRTGATKAKGGKTYGFERSWRLSSDKSWANKLVPCEYGVGHGVK